MENIQLDKSEKIYEIVIKMSCDTAFINLFSAQYFAIVFCFVLLCSRYLWPSA